MTIASTFHCSFPEQVNEYAARLVAGVVATLTVFALATSQFWVFAVLAAGFWLRVGWGPRISPLAKTAMWLAPKIWSVRPVTGAPKRFAQGIGAVTLTLASVAWLAGLDASGFGGAGREIARVGEVSDAARATWFVVLAGGIPFAVAFAGTAVWIRRRRDA